MSELTLAVLPGDGIGPEITQAALNVLLVVRPDLTCVSARVGAAAIDADGTPYLEETRALLHRSVAVLFGAVGDPRYDGKPVRPEQALLAIRKEFDLYANIRLVKVFSGLEAASTLRAEVITGIDLVVLRELTSGLYFGEPKYTPIIDGVETAVDTLVYRAPEIERIARVGFELARGRRKKLTSVDKQNVLESGRLWRRIVSQLAIEYPDVTLDHLLVDNAAMQLVRNPKHFDVMLTENTFGDTISDEAAMLKGSIGNLPKDALEGNINALYTYGEKLTEYGSQGIGTLLIHESAQHQKEFIERLALGEPQELRKVVRTRKKFEGVYCIREAASRGQVPAQFKLSSICKYLASSGHVAQTLRSAETLRQRSYHWMTKAAEGGHAEAQFETGLRNLRQKLHTTAILWLTRSADQGYLDAQMKLADIFEQDLKHNIKRCVDWSNKAVAQGSTVASQRLKKYERINRLHNQVDGSQYAKIALAREYMEVSGERNLLSALEYLEDIAGVEASELSRQVEEKLLRERRLPVFPSSDNQSRSKAQLLLGDHYSNRSISQARMWYKKSASRGNIVACHQLGTIYQQRSPQDLEQAMKYYGEAAKYGHYESVRALRLLKNSLAPVARSSNDASGPSAGGDFTAAPIRGGESRVAAPVRARVATRNDGHVTVWDPMIGIEGSGLYGGLGSGLYGGFGSWGDSTGGGRRQRWR